MKKTLLATAVIGALGASAAAQAATVYDQDGTSLNIYGRLAYAVQTGNTGGTQETGYKDDGSEFNDLGSRFGFIADHQVTRDLSVFARMELRGAGDARNNDGFDTVRNTYVGVDSNSFGKVTVGNFDNVYYQSGGVMFDVPEASGAALLGGFGNIGSHGDSIAYSTPNLEGFRAHLQAKHLSGNATEQEIRDVNGNLVDVALYNDGSEFDRGQDNSSTVTMSAAVDYTWQDLYVSVAYNQAKDVSDRGAAYDNGQGALPAGEDLMGIFASYNFTPEFLVRAKYEEVTDVNSDLGSNSSAIESIAGLGATFDYGMGDIYGDYYRVSTVGSEVDSRNQWVVGASYRFSEPMYVFAEVAEFDADFSGDQQINELNDDTLTTLGVRYDF
ncbi:Outer membrane protein (porin) [Vreelandella subterranea]|uniref:Outer membrane protein (Porin) n=1 Tax=Vreelandella subterranea TaxID=416874 RepID=A0A1H9R7U0_9GAMM|nr:porin [Halomonas subterranea]SER68782.1 Outer membrane protein (porin) [Halomonas subterranea]